MVTPSLLICDKVQVALESVDRASEMMFLEFQSRLEAGEEFPAEVACAILQNLRAVASSLKKFRTDVTPSIYEFVNRQRKAG